eukprot:gnl/TRDRNA2_/TRDRNA2_37976_c0_seq2.p1 gnl/TRDRNA2_/TRDRNA2_37976_c0~~gnl/TRDRNA2_/TRDRNA2_37976_c0_seq2.p1  ORF type:complete len:313 (-),score=74.82 gnl/TRDRNA2_/TRDRNA2_37976_c0_seq2:404-1342(-)
MPGIRAVIGLHAMRRTAAVAYRARLVSAVGSAAPRRAPISLARGDSSPWGLQWRGMAQAAESEAKTSEGKAGQEDDVKSAEGEAKAKADAADGDTKAEDPAAGAGKAGGDSAEEAKAADADEEQAAKAQEADEAPKDALKPLREKVEELEKKVAQKKNDLLLSMADFQNERNKFTKERELRRRNANTEFARRILPVYLEFSDLSLGGGDDASPAVQGLQEGISLTRSHFATVLEKHQVVQLPVELGQPSVPTRHMEVGSIEISDGSLPENTVGEIVEPGWLMEPNSKSPVVLRKAKVKIVKIGAPETPPSPE